jgi:hypothetical protein
LQENSKVVCIAHSYYFKWWTGKWNKPLDDYETIPMPDDSVWLDNCQFLPDNDNFPRNKSE